MEQKFITQEVVQDLFEKNILLGIDILDGSFNFDELARTEIPNDLLILNQDNLDLLKKNKIIDWIYFDQLRTSFELGNDHSYFNFLENLTEKEVEEIKEFASTTQILQTYQKKPKKYSVQDFVGYFLKRYKSLERILRNRQELQGVVSIQRILQKKEKENVAVIGLVKEKSITKNGNLLVELEDQTNIIRVLISKNKKELFDQAQDLIYDEVVGVTGQNGDKIIFVNSIIWPDVPLTKELKTTREEVYALVLSDIHVGSTYFLPEQFERFLKWINGEIGNEKQKEITQKVKYIFICGDLVDGVGIYPSQNSELIINDIYQQYEECARLLKKIPSRIQLIICPGNHDALRLAEPQPPLPTDFAKALYEGLPNALFVSSPATVTIHKEEGFSGLDVLIYHGYSFDYYYTEVESLRTSGAMHKPYLITKYLLKRRHLAPAHTSTLYAPDIEEDPLIINKIPDFVLTGHIHKPGVANYRNITIVSGSCWQAKTSFQEKVGHDPEPGKVPLINLKTREIKILKFV